MTGGSFFQKFVQILCLKASSKVLLVYVHVVSVVGRGRCAAILGVEWFLLKRFV
jgi:hypothetical protein